MADSTFQGIRKSLSSWSLSTIKKPRIIAPKIKKGNLKMIFVGKRKNRGEEEDKAVNNPEAKESIDNNVCGLKESKPRDNDECKILPNIYVSVHEAKSEGKSGENAGEQGSNSHKEENIPTKGESFHNSNMSACHTLTSAEIPYGGGSGNVATSVIESDPSPTSSPGQEENPQDESLDEEILFIDDSPEMEKSQSNLSPCAINLNISPEEYYSWFDAYGTLLQPKHQIPLTVEGAEEYSNYLASEYFDAHGSRTMTPASGKSYEDIEIPSDNIARPGSARAREWVKSFNEDASKRAEEILKQDTMKQQKQKQQQQNLPRSSSEVQLSNVEEKRPKKDEIVLNTENPQSNSASKSLLQKLFSKETKTPSTKIRKSKSPEENSNTNSTGVARRESIKKIFGVRGRGNVALKTPIMDSRAATYKETDIYLASTPYALTNMLNKQTVEKEQTSKSSSEANEDGILETSMDPDEKKVIAKPIEPVDDSDELLKEIEMYLSDGDNVGTMKTFPPSTVSEKSNLSNDRGKVGDTTQSGVCEGHTHADATIQSNVSLKEATQDSVNNEQSLTAIIPLSSLAKGKPTLINKTMDSKESKINHDVRVTSDPERVESTAGESQRNSGIRPVAEANSGRNTSSESKRNIGVDISKSKKDGGTSTNLESKRNSAIGIITEFKNSGISILSEFKRNSSVNPGSDSKRQSSIISTPQKERNTEIIDTPNIADSSKPVNETTTTDGEGKLKDEQFTNTEDKKQRPGAYFAKTFKSIKESVLSADIKDKLKMKEEKKKMKLLLSPLLPGTKFKGSKHGIPDDSCDNIIAGSYSSDKNICRDSVSSTESGFTKEATEDTAEVAKVEAQSTVSKTYQENATVKTLLEDDVDERVSRNDKEYFLEFENSLNLNEAPSVAYKQVEMRKLEDDFETNKGLAGIQTAQEESEKINIPEAGVPEKDVDEIHVNETKEKEYIGDIEDKARSMTPKIEDERKSLKETKTEENSKETAKEDQSRKGQESDKESANFDLSENLNIEQYAKINKKNKKPKSETEDANIAHNDEEICSQQSRSTKTDILPIEDESSSTNQPKLTIPIAEVIETKQDLIAESPVYENQNVDYGQVSGIDTSKIEKETNGLDEKRIANAPAVVTLPKPIPRTRKSKSILIKTSDDSSRNQRRDTDKPSLLEQGTKPFRYEEKTTNSENIKEDVVTNNLKPNKTTNELEVNKGALRDSGYGNSVADENSATNDPIYWEIGDNASANVSSALKTSLRRKRNQNLNSCNSQDESIVHKGLSTKLPEWIQQRPPIPSPRGKKTNSTQSLVQVPVSSSGLDIPNVKVFGASFTNLNFEEPKGRSDSKWAGEDFYSGKAASIAYGVIANERQVPEEMNAMPPSLPPRSKKTSMTSLPGSVPVEETCAFSSRQQLDRFPNIFRKDLGQKRLRRRTSPDVPPKAAPRRILKPQLTPRQALGENLRPFMESGTPDGGGTTCQIKSEDILADTLFSINSIMGQDIGGTWGADSKSGSKGGSSVTLGQVRSHLKEAFQVSPETFDDILEKVRRREAANVTLTLKVIEASDLRAKTVRGASNPYVTINIPGTGQNYRTQTEHETLSPKWREEFKLKVKNLNQDLVKMEVWHDFDPNLTSQMLAVKDLKSFSRLIKGTTAIAHKHEHHLLGAVTVPMKDIRENGVSNWFPLIKEPYRDGGKQRGSLHIDAYVTATTQSISVTEARRSHDALLARLIYHHIKTATNNNTEEENVHIPWHGQLSPEAIAAIAQHAIILGLTPPLQNLSWWIVGSRVPTADAGWLLNQLKVVQKHLIEGLYDVAVIESLADSYSVWIDNNIQRLHTLRKSFPPHSGVIAKHQFSSTVATFVALESHKQSCSLLERKEIKDLRNEVKEAMIVYMNIWWSELLEQHLKGETRIEIQIQKIIIITSELYNFLCEVQSFYSPVLLKEMNIKFFREMFLLATKKLNPCVRPPIMNMYNHLESASEPSSEDADDGKPSYTLEDGSNLWQLYVNLGRINKLGADLPVEIRKESGIYEYHKWFNKGVRRWVELARKRALQMIERAVELDSLEHVDEYCNFSSSSTDVSGIFTDVQIWWHKLEWPDPENSTILLAKILEDVCSYAMKYADLLKQKVEGLFSAQSHTDQLVISQQICTGLNNIERVRDELTRLPDAFGVRFLCEKVKNSQTGGEDASNRFSNNVKTLIENSSENLEGKVVEFIEAVIEKMTGALHHAVIQACEASSEKPLLQEVLDPALQLLHGKMSESNFKRFLQRLWEGLIHLFSVTVTRNTDKRKPSYFNGVYQILEASLNFFSPCDGAGIDRNEAKSEAFLDLLELLECLRLTTENLISRYYSERYEEQKLATTNAKGELIVRAYFTKAGKLSVEIIMAKDMHLNNETGSFVGRHSQLGSYGQQIDSYVKIQFVPSDWFPNMHEARTKTMRRSDPAVFEETFDFELKHDDNGVSGGFILFTLKDYNLGRSNTFIGEALIPLKELECVDSSCVHSVQNTYLRLTQPKQECGYHSLKALALRPGDRVACTFLKKIQTRVQGAKLKLSVTTLSSDEEKSKPKSPRLLRKIMNS